MADAARRLCRLLRFAARHLEPRLHRNRRAQRADAGTAGEGQPFDLPELVLGHVARDARSEEHTSELQSLTNLVCRLLLEKKKPHPRTHSPTTRATSAHA